VFVKDPADELRLGMPASVYVRPADRTVSARGER
jgi:hypothetical protein